MNQNTLQKIIIAGLLILLFFAIIGVNNSFNVLRWDIFGATIFLTLLSLSTRRYYWSIIFISFAILFNPWARLSLSKSEWILADVLLSATLIFWVLDYFRNYHKGLLFERFLLDKFPKQEYDIIFATKDLHKKFQRFVATDADPDFVLKERKTGKVFAVECKYRSDYIIGSRGEKGVWWKREQGDRYSQYSQKENIPVYIAIGVGGNPKNPEQIGLIPIEIIQKKYHKFIPKIVIEQYSLTSVSL